MRKALATAAAAIVLASCGGSQANSSSSTDPLSTGSSDAQVHARAVIFEQTYMKLHHVDLATAQCVQGITDATSSALKMEAALHVSPTNALGINCES